MMKTSFERATRFAVGAIAIPLFAFLVFIPGSKQTDAAQADAGKAIYASKCAACHAADGSGNTAAGKNLKLKDLRSPDVQKMSDADLTNIISKGKGKMPGYQSSLSSQKIAQVLAYVRQLGK